MNAESCDAPAVHRYHFELASGNGHSVAHSRKPAKLGKRVSSERRPVALGYLHAMVGADVDQRHRTIELQDTVQFDRTSRCHVILVGDVTNDFLDEIFHGHDAGGSTVLVENDSHVGPRAAKIVEHSLRRPAVRDIERLTS